MVIGNTFPFLFRAPKTSNNDLKFNNGHMQSSGVRCWIYTTMWENNVYWYLVSPYSKLLRPHPFHRSSLRLWWDRLCPLPVRWRAWSAIRWRIRPPLTCWTLQTPKGDKSTPRQTDQWLTTGWPVMSVTVNIPRGRLRQQQANLLCGGVVIGIE